MKRLCTTCFIILLSIQLLAQPASLPRSTPEAEGVSSAALRKFFTAANKSGLEFHGIMILRHGRVVAEGWWHPYRPGLKHMLYSVSKSFTATAVGFAVSEGRLQLTDTVLRFFPEAVPDTISPNLARLTVANLLSMAVGQEPDPTRQVMTQDDWIKAFLKTPVPHAPGSRFLYNTAATFMLAAIVEKVTGEKLLDYLRPRLFVPLGITGADWETSPQGQTAGGWGLRLRLEDLAKFGQLFLQQGQWNGKQVVPAAWVQAASARQILQDSAATQSKRDSSDWLQGYGYQMWRSRHNSFRADGAFGQYILVLPEQDAVVVINSEIQDMQAGMNLVWQYLLPAFQQEAVTPNQKEQEALRQQLRSLKLPLRVQRNLVMEKKLALKTYNITGKSGLRNVEIEFQDGSCYLRMTTDSVLHGFAFGSGRWIEGYTTRKGPSLTGSFRNSLAGLPEFTVAGAYHWQQDTLVLRLRYLESPHTETIRCVFQGNNLTMIVTSSVSPGTRGTVYKGVLGKTIKKPLMVETIVEEK
jgi:CubicO group peptidase (beta-lactamase class C family)